MIEPRFAASYYRKLAQHLMLVLTIPNDDRLVVTFGTGHETCNLEAIATWLRSLEAEVDLEDAGYRLERLTHAATSRMVEVVE